MSPPQLHPSQYAEFRQLAMRLTDKALGEHFGMGETTAHRWRLRLGAQRAPLSKCKHIDLDALVAMWGRFPVEQIAEELMCHALTVRRRARQLGLPPLPVFRGPKGRFQAYPTTPLPVWPKIDVRYLSPGRRTAASKRPIPTRWRCWRCDRLVDTRICPGCGQNWGR